MPTYGINEQRKPETSTHSGSELYIICAGTENVEEDFIAYLLLTRWNVQQCVVFMSVSYLCSVSFF